MMENSLIAWKTYPTISIITRNPIQDKHIKIPVKMYPNHTAESKHKARGKMQLKESSPSLVGR